MFAIEIPTLSRANRHTRTYTHARTYMQARIWTVNNFCDTRPSTLRIGRITSGRGGLHLLRDRVRLLERHWEILARLHRYVLARHHRRCERRTLRQADHEEAG